MSIACNTYKTAVTLCMMAVLFCSLPDICHAAWTQKAGKWFSASTLSSYKTTHYIDNNGNRTSQPRFSKQEWNGYFEYGWEDDLTLGANLFVHYLEADYNQSTTLGNTTYNLSGTAFNLGLADTEIFARKRLWQGRIAKNSAVFSLQPLLKLPSVYYAGGNPRSGTAYPDAELRLQGGYNFFMLNTHHFATLDLAYRKRFGQWHDQLKADATLGLNIHRNYTLLLQSFLTHRLNDYSPNNRTSAVINDYNLLKAQASIVYHLNTHTHVQLGGFNHVYARNTGDGYGFLMSVWRSF